MYMYMYIYIIIVGRHTKQICEWVVLSPGSFVRNLVLFYRTIPSILYSSVVIDHIDSFWILFFKKLIFMFSCFIIIYIIINIIYNNII